MSIIHPSKGIHDAIEALGKIKKDVSNVMLIVCGGDEDKQYRKYLNDLIKNLDLVDQVAFRGFVNKPFEMYKIVDAVLVCSKHEAWGRVAAESMISGKPVIGYNGGGIKEIITNNFNGLLYSDINELTTCMKTVIQNREFVKSLTTNAKKHARERYSYLKYTDKILSIITKLAK
jgi:glycosyltransferase involved in cell wall biosynthesis